MSIDTMVYVLIIGKVKLGIGDPANKITIKIVEFMLSPAPSDPIIS